LRKSEKHNSYFDIIDRLLTGIFLQHDYVISMGCRAIQFCRSGLGVSGGGVT